MVRAVTPRLFLLVASLLFSLAIGSLAAQDDGIGWFTDVEQAKQQAAAEDKLVLLHFRGDFCRPCLSLEKFVFTNPIVGAALNEHYVPVKVDVQAQPQLAKKYGISTIPHDVVITPNGLVVAKQACSGHSDSYLHALRSIAASAARANPRTFATAEQIAQSVPELGQVRKAYVPEGQSPVEGNPIAMVTSGSTDETSPIRGVGGQSLVPSAGDERKFASPAQLQQILANREAGRPLNHSLDARSAAGPPVVPLKPNAGLSVDNLRPLAGNVDAGPSIAKPADQAASSRAPSPTPMAIPSPPAGRPQTPAIDVSKRVQVSSETIPSTTVGPGESPATSPLSPSLRPTRPSGLPVALGGNCPVTWFATGQLLPGDDRWGCEHRGRLYLFRSAQLRDQFQLTPDLLSPMLAGYDPVAYYTAGNLVAGNIEIRSVVQLGTLKALYLFESESNKVAFERESKKYIDEIRHAMRSADGLE
jgi:hypothetical protein